MDTPGIPQPDSAPATSTSPTVEANTHDVQRAVSRLTRLGRWAKVLLITHRLAWIVAGAVAMLAIMGLVDYFLRWPGWLRAGMLTVTLAVVATLLYRRLRPVLLFKPSLTQIALRLEQTADARKAGLDNLLTSAMELSGQHDQPETSRDLSQPVIFDAVKRLDTMRVRGVLRAKPAVRAVSIATLAVAACLSLFVVQPQLSMIGLRRVLLPLSEAQWPKRTQVADATTLKVHPLGSALALRAALVKSPGAPDQTNVVLHYRVIDPAGARPERSAPLTSQSRTIDADTLNDLGEATRVRGTLMERLLEPAALLNRTDGGASSTAAIDSTYLEYWFTSDDDQTAPRQVRLITPPAVVDASLTVTPPAYIIDGPLAAKRELDLGPGVDQRASVNDVFEGSLLKLTINFNKPVPAIKQEGPRYEFEFQLNAALGKDLADLVSTNPSPLTLVCDSQQWTLTFPAGTNPLRIPVAITDSFGIASADESVYRVQTVRDKPPEAAILTPARDEDVLPDAVVSISAEARDDVALAGLRLQHQLARRPAGSVGAPPEPTVAPAILNESMAVAGQASRVLTVNATLKIADLAAVAGDEVWISALANDLFALNGQTHASVRSPIRKLRVISRQQLIEQLYAELAGIRRSAQRAAEDQQKTNEATQKAQPGQTSPQAQTQISELISQIKRSLQSVDQRAADAAKSQPLGDEQLEDILKMSKDLAEKANQSSDAAAQSLDTARKSARDNDTVQAATDRAEAAKSQQKTLEELQQLSAALDRGQDAFSQKLRVQQLLNDQKKLQQDTAELAGQTAGKTPEQLSPEQKAQTERVSQDQDSLARRAQEVLKSLKDKAEELKADDPEAASALKEAAQTGERNALSEQMQQASRQIRKNQQQAAQDQQQQAQQSLQQMLDQLNEAQKNRDAVLKRELASLIQTLKSLIAQQKTQIDALAKAQAAADTALLAPLDQPLIKLNGATLAAHDQAQAMGQKAQGVGELITLAAERQSAAIKALRANPPVAEQAAGAENDALARLTEALQLAEKLQKEAQQKEDARKRSELREAYQKLLTTQNDLAAQAAAAIAAPQDRRTRSLARQIADDQDALKALAADLPKKFEDITSARAFEFAHKRIDDASNEAARLLREPTLTPIITPRQATVATTLTALIEALDEAQKEDDFRAPDEGNQDDGGQGQGQGQGQGKDSLLPPIVQLKLLRQLQADALALTRQANAADPQNAGPLAADAAKLQSQLADEAKRLIDELNKGPGGPNQ